MKHLTLKDATPEQIIEASKNSATREELEQVLNSCTRVGLLATAKHLGLKVKSSAHKADIVAIISDEIGKPSAVTNTKTTEEQQAYDRKLKRLREARAKCNVDTQRLSDEVGEARLNLEALKLIAIEDNLDLKGIEDLVEPFTYRAFLPMAKQLLNGICFLDGEPCVDTVTNDGEMALRKSFVEYLWDKVKRIKAQATQQQPEYKPRIVHTKFGKAYDFTEDDLQHRDKAEIQAEIDYDCKLIKALFRRYKAKKITIKSLSKTTVRLIKERLAERRLERKKHLSTV